MNIPYKRSIVSMSVYLSIVGGLALSSTAFAQQANTQDEEEVEVIEVTGVQGSIINARNEKLLSEGIVDAYFAEEIGKSSDENITEALQRLPGVTIERGGAEGDQGTVVIRGIQPSLNLIKFNGVTLTSNTDSQSVDLTAFSADVLSSIVVAKSVRAKDEEGSLGGTIYLNGAGPLSSKRDKFVFSSEARYNDLSEEITPRFTFSGVKRISDNFGMAGSVFWDDNESRIDNFETFFNVETKDRLTPFLVEDGKKTPTTENQVGSSYKNASYRQFMRDVRKLGGNLSFQWRPEDETDIRLDMAYSRQSQDYSYIDERLPNTVSNLPLYNFGPDAAIDPTTGRVVEQYTRQPPSILMRERDGKSENFVVGLDITKNWGDWTFHSKLAYSGTEQYYQDVQTLSSANIASRTAVQDIINSDNGFGAGNGLCGWKLEQGDGDYKLPVMSNCSFYNPLNPDVLAVRSLSLRERDVDDQLYGVYFDVSRAFYDGPFTALHVGAKATKRNKDRSDTDLNQSLRTLADKGIIDKEKLVASNPNTPDIKNVLPYTELPIYPLGSFTVREGAVLEGFAPASAGRSVLAATPSAVLNFFYPDGIIPENLFTRDPSKQWEVEEETQAAYAQLDYSILGDVVTGDFGLRYVRTDVTAISATAYQFNDTTFLKNGDPYPQLETLQGQEDSNSYSVWLPSFNMRVELTDDLLLRFSAGRAMARPELEDLVPNVSINARPKDTQPTGKGGNTQLDPFLADQADLSLEWYFNDKGLLSATLFHKKMDSFIFERAFDRNFRDPVADQPCLVDRANAPDEFRDTATVDGADGTYKAGCTAVRFETSANGAEAEITGLELGYTQVYDFLPSVFQYLGTSINYTYSDSEAQLDEDVNSLRNGFPFPTTSENSINSVLFWDNKTVSLRLAHTYRDESIFDPAAGNGYVAIRDARSVLNLSANYRFSKSFVVQFSVSNLTNSEDYIYLSRFQSFDGDKTPVDIVAGDDLGSVSKDHAGRLSHQGRNYRLGVRFNF